MRRFLTFFFAAIGVLLIGLLIWLGKEKQQGPVVREDGNNPGQVSVATNGSVQLNKQNGVLPKQSGEIPAEVGLSQSSSPAAAEGLSNLWTKGVDSYLAKHTGPITFYGKVVDERNEPVPNAEVIFSETLTTPLIKTNSDVNSLFALSGAKGRYLSVEVAKPGFQQTSKSKITIDYFPTGQSDPSPADPANPFVLGLKKKGPGADLITSRYGVSPDFAVPVPRDGSPVAVDLMQRKTSLDGPLRISQVKPEYEKWKEASEWSFKMEIPGGGFVECHEEFPFEAPEAGYSPTIDFQFRKDGTNWSEHIVKDYYFTFGNPRRYGRLHLETSILSGGARLTYAINPDGSRNLEPKEPAPPARRQLPPGVTEVVPGRQ